ncbi:carboxypeptidase-like regulatory domain-containing protein [Hymenobacter sp. BT186]|uniref:Carboxypeptidase-like regulatory domain-containing protein n=1 Tax=Hymenobacter telluris TaxID=2816474 RepID=A0A939JBU0_9BACT|nr:carboxypeptidase-like regulatory domain-containing protein [Hymenobacter telluris]MBO0359501.1 carboxypeptidase-like regulatory domain-containing protein [Hymenobacter telluris]MBW3375527.1 carboxypeptidase-like regulatory domain-containing protein [Hymenobacter norwichensis]
MPTPTMLAIPQPCHENWAAMTPDAQGRHCAACNKVVLDFTQKTDAEILALLQRTAAPCGRFRADQLSRPLLMPPAPAPRWRTWLTTTATVLGLREVAAEQGRGQTQTTVQYDLLTRDEQKVAALRQRQQLQTKVDSSQHILRGKVTDKSTGQGLPGVTVLLKNTITGTSTGADGSFELALPPSTSANQLVIFSSIGFVIEEKLLSTLHEQSIIVELISDKRKLGKVVIVAGGIRSYSSHYILRDFWQLLSKPFRHQPSN